MRRCEKLSYHAPFYELLCLYMFEAVLEDDVGDAEEKGRGKREAVWGAKGREFPRYSASSFRCTLPAQQSDDHVRLSAQLLKWAAMLCVSQCVCSAAEWK